MVNDLYYVSTVNPLNASGGMRYIDGPFSSEDMAAAFAQKREGGYDEIELLRIRDNVIDDVACWDKRDRCWCYYKEEK